MDCKTARLLLEFSRPYTSELPPGELGALEEHLAICPECSQLARGERAWDDHVAAALRDVAVPPGLRERIAARLEDQDRLGRRQVRRRIYAVTGAAASLLLALVFGWQWQRTHPPRLDVAQLADNFFAEIANPDADKLDEFFQRGDKSFLAPRKFNYRFFRHGYWDELQGRKVPLLLFADGAVQARVFFLSRTQFDLEALKADTQEIGSGCKAEVRSEPMPRGVYLVLYTGDSLDPFLLRDDGRAALGSGASPQ